MDHLEGCCDLGHVSEGAGFDSGSFFKCSFKMTLLKGRNPFENFISEFENIFAGFLKQKS